MTPFFRERNWTFGRIPQAILKKSSIVFSRASDMIRRVISSIKSQQGECEGDCYG